MKTRKWPAICLAILTMCMGSCQDWGQMDPIPGNQVLPKLELVANLTFDDEELNPEEIQTFAYPDGDIPILVTVQALGQVLELSGGYARIFNPLNKVKVQDGVSLTFWMKQAVPEEDEDASAFEQDVTGAIFSFENANSTQRMFFTANGWLNYEGVDGSYEDNNPADAKTGLMSAGEWHYVAISVKNNGYFVYVDGLKKIEKTVSDFDCSKIVQFMASVPYLYIGYGSNTENQKWQLDDLSVYRNTITSTEIAVPKKGGDSSVEGGELYPGQVFFSDFERENDGTTIYGKGNFTDFGGNFGRVFQNVSGAQRSNYLILPEDVLSHSAETKELSIGVWVNAANAGASSDYMWAPLFSAYASGPATDNGTPMFVCQYRGILQVNCNGWCDFTDAQNTNQVNGVYHDATDWLADKGWHYYTVTLTETNAKVYFDGVLKNEWNVSGSGDGNVIGGLFSNGSDLKYICLGGNQAWNWGDNDAGFMFDDIAIYNKALTKAEIDNIIAYKKLPTPTYFNDFEKGVGNATIYGAGTIERPGGAWGNVFQNVGGALRSNYLVLPEDALSHTADTKQLTVAVWVNSENAGTSADYMWAPLFMAYGSGPATDNGAPMLACQYRGVLQVNCSGWCDFTDAQNTAGANVAYHDATDWLADKDWHLYTAVFTETNAKVYFDGVLKNEWNVSGSGDGNVIAGLFSNGSDLKYICLGGNQAWNWGDNDPGFAFDHISIYNVALTQEQIKVLVNRKK